MKTENLSFTLNGGEVPYIPNCPKRNEAKDTQKIEFNELSHFLHFQDKINNKPSPTLITSSQHNIIKNQQSNQDFNLQNDNNFSNSSNHQTDDTKPTPNSTMNVFLHFIRMISHSTYFSDQNINYKNKLTNTILKLFDKYNIDFDILSQNIEEKDLIHACNDKQKKQKKNVSLNKKSHQKFLP